MVEVAIITHHASRITHHANSLPVNPDSYTNYNMSYRKNLVGHFLCLPVIGRY